MLILMYWGVSLSLISTIIFCLNFSCRIKQIKNIKPQSAVLWFKQTLIKTCLVFLMTSYSVCQCSKISHSISTCFHCMWANMKIILSLPVWFSENPSSYNHPVLFLPGPLQPNMYHKLPYHLDAFTELWSEMIGCQNNSRPTAAVMDEYFQ